MELTIQEFVIASTAHAAGLADDLQPGDCQEALDLNAVMSWISAKGQELQMAVTGVSDVMIELDFTDDGDVVRYRLHIMCEPSDLRIVHAALQTLLVPSTN